MRRWASKEASGGPYNGPGSQAPRANLDTLRTTAMLDLYLLEVGVPPPAGLVVGMAYVIAERGAFAAYVATGCHFYSTFL